MRLERFPTSMYTSSVISGMILAVFPAVGIVAVCLSLVIGFMFYPCDNEEKKDFEELPY